METLWSLHHTNELTQQNMKKYIWILIGMVVLIQACNHIGSEEQLYEPPTEAGVSVVFSDEASADVPMSESLSYKFTADDIANGNHKPASYNSDKLTVKQPEKIIKTGRISIEVDDYGKSLASLKYTIANMDGYISSENEQRNDYRVSNTIVIRVVNTNFDALMDGIAGEAGKLIYKNVDLRDVTEEFTDLTARMKTKKEVEQRYLEILKTAKTVKDILEVEDKLRIIREEIESTEARLKYLGDKVQYSTITLNMSQELDYNPPAPMQVSFFDKLGKAVKGGWNGLLGGVLGLVNAWPIVLVIVLAVFFIRRFLKKRKA